MYKILFTAILVLLLVPLTQAYVYKAPTDSFTLEFLVSSPETEDVLTDGYDLENVTAVFYTHDTFDTRLSFQINKTKDLDARNLVIKATDEKTFVSSIDSEFYTMYVPNNNQGKGVFVCPDASSLDQATEACQNIIKLSGEEVGVIGLSIEDNLYKIKGLSFGSVGVGLLKEAKIEKDDLPSLASSPENNYKSSGSVVFKCEASDDFGLKQIELYTNLSGSLERTDKKSTTEKGDFLEYSLILNPGTYTWYCRAIDNKDQVVQSNSKIISVEQSSGSTPCIEEWECLPWLPIECETEQTRICTDQNNCGTETGKPNELRFCEEICKEEWVCSDWSEGSCGFRICEDLNKCDQDVEKPEEIKSCVQPPLENNSLVLVILIIIVVVLILAFILLRKKHTEEI